MPGDARYRAAWDYPDCPDCGSDVFVDRAGSLPGEYVCRLCEAVFDA